MYREDRDHLDLRESHVYDGAINLPHENKHAAILRFLIEKFAQAKIYTLCALSCAQPFVRPPFVRGGERWD